MPRPPSLLLASGPLGFAGHPLFNPPDSMAHHDPFKALRPFAAGGREGRLYSLPALEQAGLGKISRLPVSVRLVLESVPTRVSG